MLYRSYSSTCYLNDLKYHMWAILGQWKRLQENLVDLGSWDWWIWPAMWSDHEAFLSGSGCVHSPPHPRFPSSPLPETPGAYTWRLVQCTTVFNLNHQERQKISTATSHPLASLSLKTNKSKNNRKPKEKINLGKDVEKLETLYTSGRKVKWCSHYRKIKWFLHKA